MQRRPCTGLRRQAAIAGAIDAIIVTHEHVDHIRGLDVLARKLACPVYATGGTLADFLCHRRTSDKPLATHASRYDNPFRAGGFMISPFATSHDAAEPCGFVIEENGEMLGTAPTQASSLTICWTSSGAATGS